VQDPIAVLRLGKIVEVETGRPILMYWRQGWSICSRFEETVEAEMTEVGPEVFVNDDEDFLS
jgi:hypothetical protein